jgi:hypothetical protein
MTMGSGKPISQAAHPHFASPARRILLSIIVAAPLPVDIDGAKDGANEMPKSLFPRKSCM